MSLKNSLFLLLAFLFTSSVIYAAPRSDRMEQGKQVVCPVSKDYKVGDIGPSGGWIIYAKPAATGQSVEDCWRYIEAAPADFIIKKKWSNITNKSVVGTGKGIGEGKENTKKIIQQEGHKESAAFVCKTYAPKDYPKTKGEWFLPSIDELDLMYHLLAKGDNKGAFKTKSNETNRTSSWYWSSSDYGNQTAWNRTFNYDNRDHYFKYYENNVRCARAF